MTETKSVKTLKKQLGAAIAMVLVAAVALGSSTYAWFVSNNNVTANTSSISAQSNAPFLVINAGSAVTTSTTSTDATATPNQDKALFPVQMVKAEDNASAFQWESAYAEASTSADEKDKTRFIVQTADLPNYYIKETFLLAQTVQQRVSLKKRFPLFLPKDMPLHKKGLFI